MDRLMDCWECWSVRKVGLALAACSLFCCASAGARVAPRVVDGTPVQVPSFMGFVLGVSGDEAWSCAGTAIAPNVLLTAAHCVVDEATNSYVSPSKLEVVCGQDDPLGAIT